MKTKLPALCLLFLCLLSTKLFSQSTEFYELVHPVIKDVPGSKIDCEKKDNQGCNYIQNDEFKTSGTLNPSEITNPFPTTKVSKWVETHGTPALSDFLNPPSAPPVNILNYASMYSWSDDHQTILGEGIAQSIPATIKGDNYSVSFFKKLAKYNTEQEGNMAKFYIVLMSCKDYEKIHTYPEYTIADIPKEAQVIYCEKELNNMDWQQVFACFTAENNYDMIWVFPKQDPKAGSMVGVDFTGLELINQHNFSAGYFISTTIGPLKPNCSVRNAVFTWTGPYGQSFDVTNQNQQLTIDMNDPLQIGTWTLSMDVPNSVNPNNICSGECRIAGSITTGDKTVAVDCNFVAPVVPLCGNYIRNNNFTPLNSYYANASPSNGSSNFWHPFQPSPQMVPQWDQVQGSPQIGDGIAYYNTGVVPPAPAPAIGYAFLSANSSIWSHFTEGIVQQIHPLVTGNKYLLSFFKQLSSYAASPLPYVQLHVVLMHCGDFTNILDPNGHAEIVLPTNSQPVYCELDLSNTNWEQTVNSFVANDNYDMIWIYTKSILTNPGGIGGGDIAFPELIDVTGFNAGPAPNPQAGNCNIVIGPTTPNLCAFANSTFVWDGPHNQHITAPANQQIPIDASDPLSQGTWTLTMTVANVATTNNTCSQPLSASVFVPYCSICANPTAQIISSSYFESGCGDGQTYWPNQEPIIPNTQNHYCYAYECGDRAHLKTNYSSGNEWYVNDVLFNGVSGDELIYHCHNALGSPQQYKFQVKNNSQGCGILSQPTYIYVVPSYVHDPGPDPDVDYPYSPNAVLNVSTPFDISHGPGSIYNWYIPYTTTITGNNDGTPQATAYFQSNVPTPPPGGYPIPYFMGSLTVSNSIYCNGVYDIRFSWYGLIIKNGGTFANQQSESGSQDKFDIYPNPAINQFAILSKNSFSSVEISNMNGIIVKKINLNPGSRHSINIQDLPQGLYNCTIKGVNTIEVKKLLIVR